MRSLWILLLAFTAPAPAAERFTADVVRVEASDRQSLQERLIALAAGRLASIGLFLDADRAWMSAPDLSLATGVVEVRPLWRAGAQAPSLPFVFEVRPVSSTTAGGSQTGAVRVTLAVPVSREVLVTARRLRKGSAVTCADMRVERREIRRSQAPALTSCDIAPQTVARRDLPAGSVVRSTDLGAARAITRGSSVRASVASSGIVVTTNAVALADAEVGDQIDVRLRRPQRTLRARVVAPGAVQLLEGAP